MSTNAGSYIPNKDVIALCKLRAPNRGELYKESEYENHGLKILDSFVNKTNEVIKQFEVRYVESE